LHSIGKKKNAKIFVYGEDIKVFLAGRSTVLAGQAVAKF